MDDTNKLMPVSHVGRKLLTVVPMLLFFSLGFVLGMTTNSNFPNFYLPFVPPSSPIPMQSPPPSLPSPPSQSPPTLSSSLQTQQVGLMRELEPSSVMHNMTDEELFWWASMVPKVRSTPYHRVPKVAFLFLVRGDLPLRPLWEKFFAGHQGLYSIYLHTDPSYTGSPPKDSVFYGRMIPSQKTFWGDVTLLAAERRLLANALLDLNNERFALLSESCIPLYNLTTIHAVLTRSPTSFVDSFPTPSRYAPLFADRANITVRRWRKGAQWFEMDRALAAEVVADEAYFPVFRDHCAGRPACLMDEHYLPTLLSAMRWPRNANRSLTFADWKRRNNGPTHPHRYGKGEVTEEMVTEIRGGAGRNCSEFNDGATGICSMFARKFAPDTLEPLLRLAPKVMGFG
ncbi:hypothetical protein PR202_gb29884 [Eleusine coracana subsp. coracana]|uniref:Core-2/I-branching beta-1,6-N-acetylglucosaminyltransferase family protein n=1 Tax=Eleusine coracana subsp. coracana TaxID=191504 RepID=A0AAV5G0E7_ELECO|nr:hypothetical protein PR202_gb29884 [Eleusine coracana subsp. coracana]